MMTEKTKVNLPRSICVEDSRDADEHEIDDVLWLPSAEPRRATYS